MEKDRSERAQEIALFRYGVISDLIHRPKGDHQIKTILQEKAAIHYNLPNSKRGRLASETIRGWLQMYRRNGFDGLYPKDRADRGTSRTIPEDVIDLIFTLKEDNEDHSVRKIIEFVRESNIISPDIPLPPSTVHRLLSKAGLLQKKNDQVVDRRRFNFPNANDLWMSDIMHGPTVRVSGNKRRKVYLVAFIDDATRMIPHASFVFSENTVNFLPQLKKAILRRGVPDRLYVDNGATYKSKQLDLVCAKLGITLIHARPYQPEGKGKQERWFRTVRQQFMPYLSEHDTSNIDVLNAKLWGWIETEYHQSPHRGLKGKTPAEVWAEVVKQVKHVGARTDLADMFLFQQYRKVNKDRTLSLNGVIYEVDAILVGQSVIVRYDPNNTESIQIWDRNQNRHKDARPVDALSNRNVKRNQIGSQLRMSTLEVEGYYHVP